MNVFELDNLFGRETEDTRKTENFRMVKAATMFATGKFTIKEIAEMLDVTPTCVQQWMKNPFFNDRVKELMIKAGGAIDLVAQFKAEATASLGTLVELRDDTKAPQSVRRQSAKDILEWAMGKPTQTIVSDVTVRSTDPVEEAAQLERENELLRQKLNSAVGGARSGDLEPQFSPSPS